MPPAAGGDGDRSLPWVPDAVTCDEFSVVFICVTEHFRFLWHLNNAICAKVAELNAQTARTVTSARPACYARRS
jgi:hypothetical protein